MSASKCIDLTIKLFKIGMKVACHISHMSDPNRIFALQHSCLCYVRWEFAFVLYSIAHSYYST